MNKLSDLFFSPMQTQPLIGAIGGAVLGSIISPSLAMVCSLLGFVAMLCVALKQEPNKLIGQIKKEEIQEAEFVQPQGTPEPIIQTITEKQNQITISGESEISQQARRKHFIKSLQDSEFEKNKLYNPYINKGTSQVNSDILETNIQKATEIYKADFSKPVVLVVENNASDWLNMEWLFQQCIPEVNVVHIDAPDKVIGSLNEWYQKEGQLPVLILQELYLPKADDGFKLLKGLKNPSTPLKFIPVIVTSLSNSHSDIVESYSQGSASYFIKPTTADSWQDYFDGLRLTMWALDWVPNQYTIK